MLQEHQRKIERLVGMDRKLIKSKRIEALVEGVRNGELSTDDVARFTNITPEQWAELARS